MYYQILEQPSTDDSNKYRGTYRYGPAYDESLPSTHLTNVLCLEYGENDCKFDNLSDALKLYEALRTNGRQFDLCEVNGAVPDASDATRTFLGYDVSIAGWYSPVIGTLIHNMNGTAPASGIMDLFVAYFGPRLNTNELFFERHDAELFFSSALEISTLSSDYFETESIMSGLGIYSITLLHPEMGGYMPNRKSFTISQ